MRVTVTIDRRPEIADPEGTTVKRALHDLGFTETASVRMDRVIHLEVEGDEAGLLLDVSHDFELGSGNEVVASLCEELGHELSKISSCQLNSRHGVGD